MTPEAGRLRRASKAGWAQGLSAEGRYVCVISFFSALGFGIQAPAIPVLGQHLGAGGTIVGMAIGVFSLTRLLMAWPSGGLVDRLGEYWVLIAGLVIAGLGSLGAGLSVDARQLLVFRAVGGIGSVLYSIAAMSLVLRTTPAEYRGRVSGLFMAAYYLGTVAGPALGSLLAEHSVRLPFFVYALCSGIAGMAALFLLRGVRGRPPAQRGKARSTGPMLVQVLRLPAYRAALANNFAVGFAVYGVRMSMLPMFLLVVLQQPAKWIGIGMTIGAVAQTVLLPRSGVLTDTWGRKPAMSAGLGLVVLGYVLVLALPSLASFLVGMALMGMGAALAVTASSAAAGDAAGARSGTVIAGYQMAGDMGMTIGPILIGWMADAVSYPMALLATVAVLLLSFVPQLLMPRTGERSLMRR